jgi:hypothetical protein
VLHLIQLLLNLLLKIERDLPDNSRLTGSVFIGSTSLLLIAKLFPQQLGRWLEWGMWTGWICIGLTTFMFTRRKIRKWQGKGPRRGTSMILR